MNNRYLKHKPTIFTTNLLYSQIENCTERVEYQRIYSIIIEMCIFVMALGGLEKLVNANGKERIYS